MRLVIEFIKNIMQEDSVLNKFEFITVKSGPQVQKSLAIMQASLRKIDKDIMDSRDIPDREDVQAIFTCIHEHRANKLNGQNKGDSLLTCISQISFPNVICINLRNSNIVSIQLLPRVSMFLLQQLCINRNNISNIKALRKANFPNLKRLFVQHNQLTQFSALSEANFPHLEWFSVEFYSQTGLQDLSCLAKLSTSKMETLYAQRQTRIDQPNIKRKLSRSWPELWICN